MRLIQLGRPLLLLGSLGLAACASYSPRPLDPADVVQRQANTSMDPAAVGLEIERLAPGAGWDGKSWDRLSLLAAALTTNSEIEQARATIAAREAEAGGGNSARTRIDADG